MIMNFQTVLFAETNRRTTCLPDERAHSLFI